MSYMYLLSIKQNGGLHNDFCIHTYIIAEYNYIFLWDEELLVDNFDPKKGIYL